MTRNRLVLVVVLGSGGAHFHPVRQIGGSFDLVRDYRHARDPKGYRAVRASAQFKSFGPEAAVSKGTLFVVSGCQYAISTLQICSTGNRSSQCR